MVFNEQVLTALEVLRNFAENDFERHRIDVLEKDLTDPPKVEVIDDKHQTFNGVVYSKHHDGHYLKTHAIHQTVYHYYYGEIPKGYEIHHKNEDKADNDISNLQMLTKSEHQAIHKKLNSFKINFTCEQCGQVYIAQKNGRNRFCPKCRAKRKNVPRKKTCKHCGKDFITTNKRTIYCSIRCAKLDNPRKPYPKSENTFLICKNCGKEFLETDRVVGGFCSKKCKNKYYRSPHKA